MLSDKTFTYYQPEWYHDDGTNIDYGGTPDELASFCAFPTREDCEDWLRNHDYEPGDFCIHEYHDDDIEEVTLINGDGDYLVRIEEFGTDDIEDMLTDEVLLVAGSMDNLQVLKQSNETWDQFKDRVYGEAMDEVNDAIVTIEERGDFNFQSYIGTPDTEWYDEAREGAVTQVMRWMLERYPDLVDEMEE